MADNLLTGLSFAAAGGAALVGGVFFGFSNFVMAGLGRLAPEQGATAMNSINVTVINPAFMTALFGTGLLCLVAAAMALGSLGTLDGKLILAAALLYVIGCDGVTMALNVPLNNALAATPVGTPEGAALWTRYLKDWTFWNSVRTAAGFAAAILFVAAGVCRAA
ncbi:putative integral membrane protein [Sphingopyxis sp. LC81]|uniref:anthrone oxygenase family protein n=1 Tax=Sphingopyxis sp. LC81 TaxID=1502850 RepID=UPI00050E46E2|nr:anthrone oxygenase family protein [Sphingopyxis sp. LC81]KGB52194.1 putative integral membrane protein [Sphingopyxis sp. LC81]